MAEPLPYRDHNQTPLISEERDIASATIAPVRETERTKALVASALSIGEVPRSVAMMAVMDSGNTSSMARPVRRLVAIDNSLRARLSRSVVWKTHRATASRRGLPDFVIIGGQRCGTTSLYQSLAQHRAIEPSLRKEVHYFDLSFENGLDWYRAHFPLQSRLTESLAFEATPNYLASPGTPEMMHAVIPEVKLIVLLRDPVERAYSSWKLRMYEGSENRTFAAAVEDELSGVTMTYDGVDDERRRRIARAMPWSYVEKSRYAEHLGRWLEFFDRDRFLILESESLFADPSSILGEIEAFVGVEHDQGVTLPRKNFTEASSIGPSIRQYLGDYFAPHNERLEALTGLSFTWS